MSHEELFRFDDNADVRRGGTGNLKVSWSAMLPLILLGVMLFAIAYPTALLFVKSFATNRPGQPTTWGLQAWITAFNDKTLLLAFTNTFSLAAVRVAITTALAIFFAWIISRTDTPGRRFIEYALWLGFFLPLLPMTIGWVLLLDPTHGLLNKFLQKMFALSAPPFNVFSYWGIVWCHLAFQTSIRFLLITPAFKSMDAALEEAAQTSGSSNLGALLRITVPILAPAILASTALGFIKSLESFEIELVLGVPAGLYVLPTKIYDFVHTVPPLYGEATALSTIFLVFVFIMIGIQRKLLEGKQYTTITGRGYARRVNNLGPWRWVTFAFSLGFIVVTVVLPLAMLLIGTFMNVFGFFELADPWTTRHWTRTFTNAAFFTSIMNTFLLAFGAGLIGTILYSLISYLIERTRFAGRGVIELLCWIPWALPGILLSLGLLWAVLGSGAFLRPLYGTLFLLVLAIIIKETPVGTQITRAGIMQLGNELEEAAAVSGASWIATFRHIVLPLLRPTLIAVGIILFISAVREIPTVLLLSTHRLRTVSLLMLDYTTEGEFERAAVVGVSIVFLIILILLVSRLLGLRLVAER